MVEENKNSEKKVAVITGGAGLLGNQHAIALLENGIKVVLTDINYEALVKVKNSLKEYSDLLIIEQMDVTEQSSIEDVLAKNKDINILINNAAIDPKVKSNSMVETSRLEFFDLEQWNFQLNVGLTGAFLCSKIFGASMAEKGFGIILNIASDLSVIAPTQSLYKKEGLRDSEQPVKPVTYSVIKTGLVGLTKYLASYWADKGVRVNALSPGGVYNNQPEDFVKKLNSLIPMGRMANIDEYKGVVQFLCSDSSKYMTGQNIVVDGGRTII